MLRRRPGLGVLLLIAGLAPACSDGSAPGSEAASATTPTGSGAVAVPGDPTVLATSTTAPASPDHVASTAPIPGAPPGSTSPDLSTPAALGAELDLVERGLRDPTLPAAETAGFGRRQQLAFRALANHPDWDDTVIAAVAPPYRSAVRLTIDARRAVADHAATRPADVPPTTLPAWTIVEPRAPAELLAYYHEAELLTGVPWGYLAAINFVETRMGRIVGASPDGALGPMQFLPTTWADCCTGEITDPHDSIVGAAVYLAANGAPTDMVGALRRYNPNDGYIGAVDAYARNLLDDERAYYGYHAWEVYVPSSAGTVHLPVGYATAVPLDAATYLAEHPEALAP